MRKARQQVDPQSYALRALLHPVPQGVASAHAAKPQQRMGDAVKGGETRIEAVVRILKDDLDVLAKRRPVKIAGRDMADRLSLECDLALARIDQPADDARRRALAGTGFTDQTYALAGADRHGKVCHRRGALVEPLCEFLHLEQR